jgi:hypothetical protein
MKVSNEHIPYSGELKAKLALAVIHDAETIPKLAARYRFISKSKLILSASLCLSAVLLMLLRLIFALCLM